MIYTTHRRLTLAAITLSCFVVLPASAQTINEDIKIVAVDAAPEDDFGRSVAISEYYTAIVGAPYDDATGNDSGSAYLFDTFTGQQLFKLTANDAAPDDGFGISVAIWRTTAIVGAWSDDDAGNSSGSAYLFDTETGQQLFKLTAADAAAGDEFGFSVSISGTTAIVGASGNDDSGNNSGSVYLFDTRTGLQLAKFIADDAAAEDRFGYSVAISGSTAIVGAYKDDDQGTNSGSVYLINTSTGQQAKRTASDAAENDHFGFSVAISGTTAIVGASRDDDGGSASGASYLFDTGTGQQLFKLTADDAAAEDEFGYTVAISGTKAIVGAWQDDDTVSGSGSAYVFDTESGQQLAKFTASDAAGGDNFGSSVGALDGLYIVGSPLSDQAGTGSGSAYLFERRVGTDIICGAMPDVQNHETRSVDGETIRAYSVGTTACNIGGTPADWIDGTPFHPVNAVTIWKYDTETARLTQLGVTQVKHAFASLQGNVCQPCQGGGDFSHLGPGCSDPYGAGLNGNQGDLGPRTEVNGFSADFVYPYTGINQGGNNIFKRIQVKQSDIADSTATFYVEGVYVHKQDSEFGTNFNNASYRQLNIDQSSFDGTTTGDTFREVPAIYAWQAQDAGVMITEQDYAGEGRIIVASKATDLGDGTWRYDYGVYNQNSDLGVASFSVPVDTVTTDFGFNDIDYHSPVDENVNPTDWVPVKDNAAVVWNTEKASANLMGNAVRWGTMYNYWFTTAAVPVIDTVSTEAFKSNDTLSFAAIVPAVEVRCLADLTGDGQLDFFDISGFIVLFQLNDPRADFTGDGQYDFFDIGAFLSAYSAGCP